ncbi:MAG: PilC/PilY family type IV pilus protein [Woeseiaceae bacterium]|nr:PilC/PilY family type IV pilus protein [Woeseiaceae bacterium]
MNTSRNRTAWTGAGLLLTLLAGGPAVADDVELLLNAPNSNGADKPNILFILDSSGSMTTIERTQEPYVNSTNYAGSCDDSKVYWSTGSNPPDCDTSRKISRSNFVCATGLNALDNSGRFEDTMAMYYREVRRFWFWTIEGDLKWQEPDRGRDAMMECADDSGLHGGGDPQEVYAHIGATDVPFTSSENSEVDWGSSPTHEHVRTYSANYLNWYHNSPVTEMSRTDIVKTVTKNVLNSIQNANVGLMRFNHSQGGVVYQAVKDLDTNRAQTISQVDSLPADGWTPLSETMYEAARYWRGMSPVYGGSDTDPDALDTTIIDGDGDEDEDDGSLISVLYKKPSNFACAKNFNVLLTDGEPTKDVDAYDRVPKLPEFTTKLGRSSCTGGYDHGTCLDDAAEYLSKVDINDAVAGEQTVATYTIGFTVDLPLLKETAENSGGEYYLASDVKSLTAALTEIITNIFDRDVSFTAPAVSVNAFNRTQHLNDLYISAFRAKNKVHWPGNLKKFKIKDGEITDKNGNPAVNPDTGYFADGSHSYWTDSTTPDGPNVTLGGAANKLPDPTTRRLFTSIAGTDLTVAENAISPSNADSFTPEDFGLSGTAGEPSVTDMIQWARGVDVRDQDNDPNTLVRYDMGDTMHSQPASVVYGGSGTDLDIVVFTATNDGYLHAIDAETGVELWSFVPEELLAELSDLYYDKPINYKHYGIDGDIVPVIADRNGNGTIEVGTDFVYLVFGMRRGGYTYYAMDVTDKNNPKLKWIQSLQDFGQTWSPGVVAKVDVPGVNADKAVLVVGGGYDTTHDQPAWPDTPDGEGAGIHMLDLHSGAELWRAGPDAAADRTLSKMTRAIPSRIRVLDMSGDGFADRMYAVDIGGQLWRFDIHNGKPIGDVVTGGVVARVGPEGLGSPSAAQTRRFYAAPDVSMFRDEAHDRRYLAVSFGSGYRSHPLNKSATDRFYSFRDPNVFTTLNQSEYDFYAIAADGDFVDVQGRSNVTLNSGDRGWKYTLPAGEMVLAESQTFDDTIYFVSFEPDVASVDPCAGRPQRQPPVSCQRSQWRPGGRP